ncbi:hypothetical protein BDW66DRAFT_143678 [Aspergillus desertorum]
MCFRRVAADALTDSLRRTVDMCHVLWLCLSGVGLLDLNCVQIARRIQGLHSSCSFIPTRA